MTLSKRVFFAYCSVYVMSYMSKKRMILSLKRAQTVPSTLRVRAMAGVLDLAYSSSRAISGIFNADGTNVLYTAKSAGLRTGISSTPKVSHSTDELSRPDHRSFL